jgi:hypothetical protein
MRLILSRKGFDSAAGGCPSPIFSDGSMLSLPIPDKHAQVAYQEIRWQRDVGELVEGLTGGKRPRTHFAHLDPDLRPDALTREPGWRPMLGQHASSQSHLRNQGVGPGDLFLFWGLFRHVDETLRWRRKPMHVIWGWLQVDQVVRVDSGLPQQWPWARQHPHLSPRFPSDESNTLYLAADSLSLDGKASGVPGAGVFERFDESRRLTAEDEKVSVWSLPRWLKPDGRTPLSYNTSADSWTDDGDRVRLKAASRGQEFVLDLEEYPEGRAWLSALLGV